MQNELLAPKTLWNCTTKHLVLNYPPFNDRFFASLLVYCCYIDFCALKPKLGISCIHYPSFFNKRRSQDKRLRTLLLFMLLKYSGIPKFCWVVTMTWPKQAISCKDEAFSLLDFWIPHKILVKNNGIKLMIDRS